MRCFKRTIVKNSHRINSSHWNGIGSVTLLNGRPGPRFNIKMSSCQYRKSLCGDNMVIRSSYLHNGISYTGKTASSYWIRSQAHQSYIVNKWVSEMWIPLGANREPALGSRTGSQVCYMFLNIKQKGVVMHAPHTRIMAFWHICNIPQGFHRVKFVIIPHYFI